jgi:hypothetical protein
MQSGQDQWCSLVLRQECFADAPLEQSERRLCSCGLRVIVLWWRSSDSRSGLQRAAVLGVARHWRRQRSSRRLLSLSLPICGGLVFCLRALFVWWCCSLRRVIYECFFLYDVAVLLPFISRKKIMSLDHLSQTHSKIHQA